VGEVFERVRNADKEERIRMRQEDGARFERIEASIESLRVSMESMRESMQVMREEDIERRSHDWDKIRDLLEQDRRANFDERVIFERQMQRWIISTLTALVAAGILGGFGALYALMT